MMAEKKFNGVRTSADGEECPLTLHLTSDHLLLAIDLMPRNTSQFALASRPCVDNRATTPHASGKLKRGVVIFLRSMAKTSRGRI